MKMKGFKCLNILLAVVLVLGCGIRTAAEELETNKEYSIVSISAEGTAEKQYHWVILQSGRTNINQKGVDAINEQLKQRGISASVSFHIVQTADYITPEVLEAVYQQLDGKMDFVSMSPSLSAFSKAEWVHTFVDLTDELQDQEGKLNQFYQTVPAAAWEANEIADGIYSFSSSKTVSTIGFGFWEEAYQQLGEENLLKLQQTNGIEDETVWKELYDLRGEAVVAWDKLTTGLGVGAQENNYDRQIISGITNWWDRTLFSYFTDDIRYNPKTEEFEWLGSSETYLELKDTVIDFFHKGYIRALDMVKMSQDMPDAAIGRSLLSYSTESKINEEEFPYFWVSNGKLQVSPNRNNLKYVYSSVYQKAQTGWEEILNVMGADEIISDVLNQRYDMTISSLVYSELATISQQTPEQVDDQYAFIDELYSSAEPDPLQGFVFNPLPIAEKWKVYNSAAYGLATGRSFTYKETEITEEGPVTVAYGIDLGAIEAFWTEYTQKMKELEIEKIVGEVNRQYQEWQLPISAVEKDVAESENDETNETELSPRLKEFYEQKEAKEKALEQAQAPRRMIIKGLIGGLILIIIWMLIRKGMMVKAKQGRKEKSARIQIATIDKSNGEAERNARMHQGGQFTLSSSVARSTAEMVYLSVYRLDHKNKKLKLKVPLAYTKEMNEGDIGEITYVGDELLSYKKVGTIKDEDKKRVKFRL